VVGGIVCGISRRGRRGSTCSAEVRAPCTLSRELESSIGRRNVDRDRIRGTRSICSSICSSPFGPHFGFSRGFGGAPGGITRTRSAQQFGVVGGIGAIGNAIESFEGELPPIALGCSFFGCAQQDVDINIRVDRRDGVGGFRGSVFR
jgi:hypothetical protein